MHKSIDVEYQIKYFIILHLFFFKVLGYLKYFWFNF